MGMLQRPIFGQVYFFPLQRLHEAFRHCVVVRVAPPHHVDPGSRSFQQADIGGAGVIRKRVPGCLDPSDAHSRVAVGGLGIISANLWAAVSGLAARLFRKSFPSVSCPTNRSNSPIRASALANVRPASLAPGNSADSVADVGKACEPGRATRSRQPRTIAGFGSCSRPRTLWALDEALLSGLQLPDDFELELCT